MEDDNKKNADCQIVPYFSVYVLYCVTTEKYYVGVTGQQVSTRIRQHKRGKQFIDREIQRTGWKNWDWWIVEKHVPANLISDCEQKWVKFFYCVYPKGYNQTIGGIKHFKHSKATCKKMSKSHTGKKLAPFTEEHRANISKSRTGEKNPNFGKPAWNRGIPCPEETKNKISDTLTGRERPDQSERMKGENNPNFGKHLSEETKDKLRAKALERDVSGENNPFYGKHHTEESKEKNRQAHLGKPSPRKGVQLSEETKAKMRATRAAKESAAAQEITP